MAHSDALIFLTNITWIFFLFLFVYFGFVLFFLPTLYKKFRTRILVKRVNYFGSLLAVRGVLVSLVFFFDVFRGLGVVVFNFVKNYMLRLKSFGLNFCLIVKNSAVFNVIPGIPFFALNGYYLNLAVTDSQSVSGGVMFTKYNKL